MNRIVHIPITVRNGGALVTKRLVYIQFVSLSLNVGGAFNIYSY